MIGHGAPPRHAADVARIAQLACLLEASAPKPGNVSPGRHFADACYEDFLASAVAVGEPLAGAAARPLGTTIRLAIEATARWTRSNTNLGMVLLLAPLARAALEMGSDPGDASTHTAAAIHAQRLNRTVPGSDPGTAHQRGPTPQLQAAVRRVLDETTVEDAREVYRAIRLAAPGGLGHASAQDVASDPTMTLVEVMRLAAARDGIAAEYASGFERTFRTGAPALAAARLDGLPWADAVVEAYLTLLADAADTHIARRAGEAAAAGVSHLARAAVEAGGVRSEGGRRALEAMDRELRAPGHRVNPGTTADLTAAAIFVVLLEGGWDKTS